MKVGIIGAGTMGSGIAQAFAMTEGYEVRLCKDSKEHQFPCRKRENIKRGRRCNYFKNKSRP